MYSYLFYSFIKSFSIFGAQWYLSTAFRSSWILMVHLLKFNKIFPRLAAVLAGWKASKPMLQELSLSSSSVPWWRRQRLCLKRRFTYLSNYLMRLLVWESFTEFSYHESFRLHAYQNGSVSLSIQTSTQESLNKSSWNLILGNFRRNCKAISVLV